MSGLRFKVGELAVLVVAQSASGRAQLGEVREVVAVGPFKAGHEYPDGCYIDRDCDYRTTSRLSWTGFAGVFDYQLRKLDPPAEPASLTRQQSEELTA